MRPKPVMTSSKISRMPYFLVMALSRSRMEMASSGWRRSTSAMVGLAGVSISTARSFGVPRIASSSSSLWPAATARVWMPSGSINWCIMFIVPPYSGIV